MTVKIKIQGPIHSLKLWAATEKCVDYVGQACGWEAKIDYQVEMNFEKVLAEQRQKWAEEWLKRNKPRGATMTSAKKRAENGFLYLIAEITKHVRFDTQDKKPCNEWTEEFCDIFLLPPKGKPPFVDECTVNPRWSLKCTGRNVSCRTITDWNAHDVYVAFMLKENADGNTEAFNFGKTPGGGTKEKGTYFSHTSHSTQPPKPTEKEDVGAVKNQTQKEWEAAQQAAETKEKEAATKAKAAHTIVKIPGESTSYQMHPVVPHCKGTSVADQRNQKADDGNLVIPAEVDSNGDIVAPLDLSEDDVKGGAEVPSSKSNVVPNPVKSDDTQKEHRMVGPGSHVFGRSPFYSTTEGLAAPDAVGTFVIGAVRPGMQVAVVEGVQKFDNEIRAGEIPGAVVANAMVRPSEPVAVSAPQYAVVAPSMFQTILMNTTTPCTGECGCASCEEKSPSGGRRTGLFE